jgi:hypothetical protein
VIVVSALLASATGARGEPTVEIRAHACPSASAIAQTLPARVHVADAAPVVIEVAEVEGGALVRIIGVEGTSEVRLDGRDCAVLASAAAALADAWFVELPAPLAQDDDIDAPPEPTLVVHQVQPVKGPSARWTIAAGLALVVEDGPAAPTTATHATLEWWRWHETGLQLRLVQIGPTRLSGADITDEVSRQAWTGSLLVAAKRSAGRLWIKGGAGAAVVMSEVDAVMARSALREQGALAATASGGLRLWRGASLRLDVGGLVYPVRDRYTLRSTTIARSPWAELALGGGLDITFGERSR